MGIYRHHDAGYDIATQVGSDHNILI
jgi:urocanate hydratase